jgi:hypothetical protein
MKSFISLLITIPSMLIGSPGKAQIKHLKTETVSVYGNCDMCKKKIEASAFIKKESAAVWNKDTKTATLSFDSTKTTADLILKRIALAGYDNKNYLAPDAAYSKLDECCKYDRKEKSNVVAQNNPHSGHSMSSTSSTNNEKQQSELSAVYNAYFAVKDALIKGDGKTAAAKAKELYSAVDAVPMDKLPAAQHTVWMKYMKDISYNAEHIKGTTEVDHQREHFAKLSLAMFEVMKAIKADYPIYYDHCPMYNDGKGADWLSKESGIKNPYYGSQMLTCGSTKEVIK